MHNSCFIQVNQVINHANFEGIFYTRCLHKGLVSGNYRQVQGLTGRYISREY